MKKFLLSALFAMSLISVPAFSFEWGGIFRNETGVANTYINNLARPDTYSLNQSNSLYLWANKALTSDSSWYLSTEALYKYKLNLNNGVTSFTNIVDLDLLKVTGQVVSQNAVLNIAAGRFFVFDNSTSVFAQTCDGLSLKVSFPVADLSFYSGFTGLLNGLTVTMIDKTSYASASIGNTNQFYSLSHPYVPLFVSAEFPTFAGVQTLGIQASAFLDLDANTRYNRYYANLMMKGPVYGSLFYSVCTTFGFPDFQEVSNLTTVTLSGYADNVVALYASLKYASGEQGFLKPFRGFSSCPAYNSSDQPELSGVLIPGLKALFSFGRFDVSIDSKYVLTCPKNIITFEGIEAVIGTNVNIFSDLQLSFNVQAFISFTGMDTAEKADNSNYKANLNLSFSF